MIRGISALAIVVYLSTISCMAQWQRTNGPEGGPIEFLVQSNSTIFAGTFMGGIYTSSDHGNTWSCNRAGLTNTQVLSMIINGPKIFLGTSGGIFQSTDNGINWSPGGLNDRSVHSFAAIGDTIYAGTWNGIFWSTDLGANWSYLNGINLPISSIKVSGSNVFAGTINGGGVFLSTDYGKTWSQKNTGLTNLNIYELEIYEGKMYAGTEAGLFVSINNGNSWTAISPRYAIVALTFEGSKIFISAGFEGVKLSNNEGAEWTPINNGLKGSVSSLLMCENELYAGSEAGVFKSTDYGSSWAAVNNGLYATSVWALTVNGDYIFAGTDGGTPWANGFGIFSSTDFGNSWNISNSGLTSFRVSKIIAGEKSIFAATLDDGVFISRDNGRNWTNAGLKNTSVNSLALCGSDLYASTNNGIFISKNEGKTWACIGLNDKVISCVAAIGSKIFVGTVDGIFLSTNNGLVWNEINNGLTNGYVTSITIIGRQIYATTAGGIFSTNDDGANWYSSDFASWTYSLLADGSEMYAATSNGVALSEDYGNNWNFSSGFDNFQVLSLALKGDQIFAGTLGGSVWSRKITRGNKFVIKGNVIDSGGSPIKGVLMYGLPGNPLTDSSGYFMDSVPSGWSGVVTPVKKAHSFDPAERSYVNTQMNLISQYFTGVRNSYPSIHISSDSISINQIGVFNPREPSYVYINNSEKNTISQNIKYIQDTTRHQMGSLIPDSVVRYWKGRSPKASLSKKVFPTTIDWSISDSPVKDQGNCGSCWAFAATALIENLGNRNDLSEQVVVSCSEGGGCEGGYFEKALLYYQNTGVPDESCYPYTQTNGACLVMCASPSFKERISTVSGTLWGITTPENLKEQLQNGPLVVRMLVPVDNSFDSWPGYQGGIYDYNGDAIPEERGHAVLLVGYDDNQQCFKAKNSWGPGWGEYGYFRISYDDVLDDVHFGSYAISGSGVYTDFLSFTPIAVSNIGNDDLVISSVSDDQEWLTIQSDNLTPFSILPNDSLYISVSINWSLVGSSVKTGIVTIKSDDPITPSVSVKITAIPMQCEITPPSVDSVIQPSCTIETGNVFVNNLPENGNWNLIKYPGSISYSGSGTNTVISGLDPGVYTFTVTNASGCTSDPSIPVVINNKPEIPAKPFIGDITQPTCAVTTGNFILNNLPAEESWILIQNPTGIIYSGTGTNKTISDLAPGIYSFAVINESGCTSELSDNACIDPPPDSPLPPSIGPVTQPSCTIETGTVFLYDLPANNTWIITQNPEAITYAGNGTGTMLSGIIPGTHSFTVTNDQGCTSKASGLAEISTQPHLGKPIATLNNGSLHSDATEGNQWYDQNGIIHGAVNQDFTAVKNGDYYVIVTRSGCISDPSDTVHFVLTGIQPDLSLGPVKVYPNPVSNILIIELENNNDRINFEIFNSTGQKVFNGILTDKTIISTNSLQPGIYFIKCRVNGNIIIKKFTKE